MVRLTYLIPRLIILTLVALALWVGKDPLIRSMVIGSLENRTGAKVEIGQLRSSLENQKIFFRELSIADPRDPMVNLVQTDMAYVEFDFNQLLRRRVVIEHAQASQIMFGSPRTNLGVLPGATAASPTVSPAVSPTEGSSWEPKRFVSIQQLGRNWIDRLQPDPEGSLAPSDFELVRISSQLKPFWDQEIPAIKHEIAALHTTWEHLKAKAEADRENTLRPQLFDADVVLSGIAKRTERLSQRIKELGKSADASRAKINEAFDRDVKALGRKAPAADFDSDQISRLLLTQLQEQYIGEIIGWLTWFQASVPDPEVDFQPKTDRGVNVQIPGINEQPGFLLKTINLEGEGRFANQYFSFAGAAHNLTSQPALHDQPTTFELRAQGDGSRHVIVSCTLDRRGDEPMDQLKIICPDLEIDSQLLGEKNSVWVTMGPAGRIQAEIEIQTVGDQLSGELVFHHSNVSLHVDHIHEMAGGEDTALRLNQGLASVDHFETRITLSGTIRDYEYEFESDLGSQFAKSANSMMAETNLQQISRQKTELEKLRTVQLSILDNEIAIKIQQLQHMLTRDSAEIADLSNTILHPFDRVKRY